jgi:hypothetical protein
MNWLKALGACAGIPAALPIALAAGAVDFESWRQVGSPVWRFDADGAEAGPGDADSFLVSDAVYGDFELAVEFWIEDDTNSGVFVRCGEIDGVDAINPFDCLEVNIYDSHPKPDYRTGAIVTRAAPSAEVDTLGRWNRLEIRALGARLDVAVNGIPTANIEDARVGAGPVALQYAGTGLVRFRKLDIEALSSENAPRP